MINFVKVLRKDLQNPSKPKKTYAQAQSRDEIDVSGLAAHMTDHGCPFSKGTTTAVLTDAIACIRELLLEGYIVKLGDMGTFYVTLKSEGVCENQVDMKTGKKPVFTAANITGVNVRWSAGKDMKNLVDDATFEQVVSHAAAAAAVKDKQSQLSDGTWIGDKGLVKDEGE